MPTESQPLLAKRRFEPSSSTNSTTSTSSASSAIATGTLTTPALIRLCWLLWADSLPVILSYILQNSIQTTSVVIAGRLGPNELSVAAFALMFAMVSGWCVALGGTTALDTLGSQAFTGGASPAILSIHFQRCVLLLWILFIPVAILWFNVGRILLFLEQDPDLCRDVQTFLRVLTFGAPGYIAFESLKKYLQCQGIMRLSTIALILASPINIALNLVLIHYTPLGLLGSPISISLTYWLCFFFLCFLTYISPAHRRNRTWGAFKPRLVFNTQGCMTFFKLAIPGILMVGTEWAAFEIVALAAGRLGHLSLAAQSIIMTTDQVLNTIPFGIGVAASARVGNLIGSRSPLAAKFAGHASAMLSVIVGSVIMFAMLLAKDVFGYIFSDEHDVVLLVSKVLPLVASFQIADGLAGSCGGVLRGQGRQHLGAMFNLVAYYVLALPMGITLAFHSSFQLGLQGLWIGQVVALFIVGLGEYTVVWLGTDWEKEVQRGIERNCEEAMREGRREIEHPNERVVV